MLAGLMRTGHVNSQIQSSDLFCNLCIFESVRVFTFSSIYPVSSIFSKKVDFLGIGMKNVGKSEHPDTLRCSPSSSPKPAFSSYIFIASCPDRDRRGSVRLLPDGVVRCLLATAVPATGGSPSVVARVLSTWLPQTQRPDTSAKALRSRAITEPGILCCRRSSETRSASWFAALRWLGSSR